MLLEIPLHGSFSPGSFYKFLHAHALDDHFKHMTDIKTNTCKCLLFLNSVKDSEVLFIFCKTIHDFSSHIKGAFSILNSLIILTHKHIYHMTKLLYFGILTHKAV